MLPPLLDGTDAAFPLRRSLVVVRDSKVGVPSILGSWHGKLLMKSSIVGTELVIVMLVFVISVLMRAKNVLGVLGLLSVSCGTCAMALLELQSI